MGKSDVIKTIMKIEKVSLKEAHRIYKVKSMEDAIYDLDIGEKQRRVLLNLLHFIDKGIGAT